MTTISSALCAVRGLPAPGAFPRPDSWPAASIGGGNRVRGAMRVNDAAATRGPLAGTILGQVPAQPAHADKARSATGERATDKRHTDKRDMGSQPRRAPV